MIAGCHTRAEEEIFKTNTQVHIHREDKSVTRYFDAQLLKTNINNKNFVASSGDIYRLTLSYSQLGETRPLSYMSKNVIILNH